MAANLLFRTNANSSPVASSVHVFYPVKCKENIRPRTAPYLAVFAFAGKRSMSFLWANLACIEHHDRPHDTEHGRMESKASGGRGAVRREPDVQSSYITNEAQREESRPNISILRQLTALALPPGAKHDQSPRVHGLHAVCWSIRRHRLWSWKMSSYPMQSTDCTVSAYFIQLISKTGQRLLQPRQRHKPCGITKSQGIQQLKSSKNMRSRRGSSHEPCYQNAKNNNPHHPKTAYPIEEAILQQQRSCQGKDANRRRRQDCE